LAQRQTNSDQKQARIFETQIDDPGIGLNISIESFPSENACFPKVALTGMRFPIRKMKAFCLKAFLFFVKLIKNKSQIKIKS